MNFFTFATVRYVGHGITIVVDLQPARFSPDWQSVHREQVDAALWNQEDAVGNVEWRQFLLGSCSSMAGLWKHSLAAELKIRDPTDLNPPV